MNSTYTIQKALHEYFLHCNFEKKLSNKTMKAYKIDLAQLNQFLVQKNNINDIDVITKSEIRNYLESISNLKPKSIKRKIASIKAFFNYLEYEDVISVNPLRKMRIRIKEPSTLPRVMDLNEITRMLKIAYTKCNFTNGSNSFHNTSAIRNIVVLELLFGTGARVSEIAELQPNDINLKSGQIIIHGKGKKERIIHICNKETLEIMKNYRDIFTEHIAKNGYFLVNRLGKKLTDQSIRTIVKNYAKQAGIVRTITPHVFRHSFATLLLERDVDIKYIQSLLGHSSIMTTQIYTHVNRIKQKKILSTKHPRKSLNMSSYSLN